jgi:N-acetylglutamate synthase-like GNAT family acetyltransferase
MENIKILITNSVHVPYATTICTLIESAAKQRGTGIAKRDSEVIATKIANGNAVIALHDETVIGFCYLQVWEDERFVSHSGLIVDPEYRKFGLAKRIKEKALELAREKYQQARIFGITTSQAVIRINTQLGYEPTTFSDLPQEDSFWKQCMSCPNYDILLRTARKMCLCTAMIAVAANEL